MFCLIHFYAMYTNLTPIDAHCIFHPLGLASIETVDGLDDKEEDRVVCFRPPGTKLCLPINMGKFLADGIYVEPAYWSHVRSYMSFSSKPQGSRRVVQEFGFFHLTLLMSEPMYNDVRKKIYNILAYLAFSNPLYHRSFGDQRPIKVIKKMYELL